MIILARKILPITSPEIDNGGLLLKGRNIIAIGRRRELLKSYPSERVVDFGDCAILPGLVNTHTHLDLSHLKGLVGEHEDFFEWISALVELKRRLGHKGLKTAARKALQEAIRTGTTCIGDINSFDETLPLIVRSGIRAVSFLEVIGLDGKAADATFNRLLERLNSLDRLPDRVTTGISPHSPYSVSGQLYSKLNIYTSSNNTPIAIHVSESKDESLHINGRLSKVDGYLKKFGWDRHKPNRAGTPLGFIMEVGLYKGLLAVHAVHVTKGDMALLKRSGASVAHCPRSNHLLRVGKAPIEDMISRGINVGVGTDSLASNMDLNLWEEMRFTYLVNKLRARQVMEMATINGARALGLGHVTGSLEPDKEADLIAVRHGHSGNEDVYLRLVMETRPDDVAMTMVQGRPIYLSDAYKGTYGL